MGKTCNETVGNADPIAKKKLEDKLETLEEERDQLLMTQAVLEKVVFHFLLYFSSF